MTNFFLLLTNTIILISLPGGLCYDTGIMGASFNTHDDRPIYGLRVEVMDSKSNMIAGAWAFESYVPPMTETVSVTLVSEAAVARCEIVGSEIEGKWKDAYFYIVVNHPKLNIFLVGTNLILSWVDYGRCWKLESSTNWASWAPSKLVISATNKMGFFK